MMRKKEEQKKQEKTAQAAEEQNIQGVGNEQPVQDNPDQQTDTTAQAINEQEGKIAELTAALAASQDKYLRLSAEFDNFRKRTVKEKMDLMKYASESVLVNFLPVIDDVERALSAIETSDNLETTKEGITLIYNKFKDFTRQNGVSEMEAYGLELNTDHHEAITKIPAPSDELKGKIVDVVQKGYLLNEKVIRFAKVVIGE